MVVRRRPGGGCAFALMLSMALAVVGGAAATAAATEETSSHAPPWLLSDDGLIGDCTNDGNTGVEARGPTTSTQPHPTNQLTLWGVQIVSN